MDRQQAMDLINWGIFQYKKIYQQQIRQPLDILDIQLSYDIFMKAVFLEWGEKKTDRTECQDALNVIEQLLKEIYLKRNDHKKYIVMTYWPSEIEKGSAKYIEYCWIYHYGVEKEEDRDIVKYILLGAPFFNKNEFKDENEKNCFRQKFQQFVSLYSDEDEDEREGYGIAEHLISFLREHSQIMEHVYKTSGDAMDQEEENYRGAMRNLARKLLK